MRFAILTSLLSLLPAAEPKGAPVEPWEMGRVEEWRGVQMAGRIH
jgi:hypothetical protein